MNFHSEIVTFRSINSQRTMSTFAYTILYVKDVLRTVEFYENAFGCTRKFIAPENVYAELVTGSTTLSFASWELAASNLKDGFTKSDLKEKPFGIEIGFATNDVEAVLTKSIAAGGTLVEAAKTKPWGQVVAYVRDPDGFLIEVCTPMGD